MAGSKAGKLDVNGCQKERKREYPPWQTLGRPMEYDETRAAEICKRISNGEPLRKILADKHMPSFDTVYNWIEKYPEFLERYRQARACQAETFADETVALADSEDDPRMAGIIRERINARQWAASKIAPKKYGDLKQISIDDQRFAHLTDEQILQRIEAMAHQLGYSLVPANGQIEDQSDVAEGEIVSESNENET